MSVVKDVLFTSPDTFFGLLAIPEKSNISLMWKPVKGADSYKVYQNQVISLMKQTVLNQIRLS